MTTIDERTLSEDFHSPYIYLPEYTSEHLYSFFLSRLLVFKQSLTEKIAFWRESTMLVEKIAEQITKFHLPEVQDRLCGFLFEDIQRGNK